MNYHFSVLLSLYYKETPSHLRQCFESIFHQTLCPNEIILVKDGPLTKELDEVVEEFTKKYSMFKVVPLKVNQGLGRALNEGLKYCSNNIVARMDTDDIAKPNRFLQQIEIFEKYKDVDVVGSWIDEFEKEINNLKTIRKLPEMHDEIIKFAKKRNPMNHPVVMFNRNAVMAVGGYKHFPLFEDYYLWIRLLMNGAKFYNIQESLLYFRFSPEMFKRRGGWKYAMDELHFQWMLRQEHFISTFEFLRNVAIRFSTRIIPNSWRTFIYKKMLR